MIFSQIVPIAINLYFRPFPALCALYGAELQKKLEYPVGLISSAVGGTYIEAWSTPNGLSNCAIPNSNFGGDWGTINNNHVLYNGMIRPLTRFNIFGAIWYQGENNAGYPEDYTPYNMDKYWCAFR